MLDVAVVPGAIGGAATCGAVLAMFIGALREETTASLLFALFGLAVVSALCTIAAYTVEMLMAGTDIRAEVAQGRRSATEDAGGEAEDPQQGGEDGTAIEGDAGP